MRFRWPHCFLFFTLFGVPLAAISSSIQCPNETDVIRGTFPEGTVLWTVTAASDESHVFEELTITVIADAEIDGKIFGGARVYVGDDSGQSFGLHTSTIIPVYGSGNDPGGISVTFGTSANFDRSVTFKFSYFSKSLCPEDAILYELPLSEMLKTDNDKPEMPEN